MTLDRLRDFTPARVGMPRTGHSITVRDHLEFQLAHARARDAVHTALDADSLRQETGAAALIVSSAATDRWAYLRRPDLGRQLSPASRETLRSVRGDYDIVFALVDGLSARAVQTHAAPLLNAILPALGDWTTAPLVITTQGRVALGDEIADVLGARLAVVLIGERPGLSSPDSLGAYVTWSPQPAITTDAQRNCVSNIRLEGLSYAAAAGRLLFLLREARQRKLTGVGLKEEGLLELAQ